MSCEHGRKSRQRRAEHVERALHDESALHERDALVGQRREGGVAAEDPDAEEETPCRGKHAALHRQRHDDAEQERPGDVDDEGPPRKRCAPALGDPSAHDVAQRAADSGPCCHRCDVGGVHGSATPTGSFAPSRGLPRGRRACSVSIAHAARGLALAPTVGSEQPALAGPAPRRVLFRQPSNCRRSHP